MDIRYCIIIPLVYSTKRGVSLVMSLRVSFCAVPFPTRCLG